MSSLAPFWEHCLTHFRERLNAQQYNTWLKPLEIGEADGHIQIRAKSPLVAQWVRDRYLDEIERLAEDFFHGVRSISVKSGGTGFPAPARPVADKSGGNAPRAPASVFTDRASEGQGGKIDDSRLNPLFTFGNFVPGKANELARAAGMQISENPGVSYNPLFVYGGVGLGKTHLIQAIANQLLATNPKAHVRYIHAERYVSDMVRAFRHKAFDEFKHKYSNLDLLLVDDIQFFAGKDRSQEEFFYTFNNLIEAGKQVILTSDSFPKNLSGIEERLKSRFSWGLTVMLEPPDTEMRVAILLNKAQLEGVSIDEPTAFFIAKQVRSNVRELEGALNRVIAYSRFHQKSLNVDLARDALKDLLAAQRRQVAIENIQKVVCDYYKIKIADLYSKSRKQVFVRPRQMAMLLAKELTSLSYPEIGASFGGRDHSTVVYAVKKLEELRAADTALRRDYSLLLQVLTG